MSAQSLADSVAVEDSVTGHDIVEKAKEFLGVPYRYGSMNPKRGFDCSGPAGGRPGVLHRDSL